MNKLTFQKNKINLLNWGEEPVYLAAPAGETTIASAKNKINKRQVKKNRKAKKQIL